MLPSSQRRHRLAHRHRQHRHGIASRTDWSSSAGPSRSKADDGIRGQGLPGDPDGTLDVTRMASVHQWDRRAVRRHRHLGGTVTVNAGDDGAHAEGDLAITGGTVTIAKSSEGLEGTSRSPVGAPRSRAATTVSTPRRAPAPHQRWWWRRHGGRRLVAAHQRQHPSPSTRPATAWTQWLHHDQRRHRDRRRAHRKWQRIVGSNAGITHRQHVDRGRQRQDGQAPDSGSYVPGANVSAPASATIEGTQR